MFAEHGGGGEPCGFGGARECGGEVLGDGERGEGGDRRGASDLKEQRRICQGATGDVGLSRRTFMLLMASYASPRFVDNFWGGFSLRDPVGGSAKGIPANFSTSPLARPTTVLDAEITTVGEVALASITGDGAGRAGKARAGASKVASKVKKKDFIVLHKARQLEK